MFYDIDEYRRQTELGVMIGEKEFWSHGYGTDAVRALVHHIFESTRLNRVYLHTLDWNVRAQKSFVKAGFVPINTITRRGYTFVTMEILREWVETEAPGNSPTAKPEEARS
ncbi:MAG: GNAT family N-acetyltransferase [Chloroflexi bacterium]|nr:GNAT family N-acetyltransferase [Chloroflexota bacterium]